MNRVIKILFFAIIVKPLIWIVLGLNIRNRKNLPQNGPAIIAANHNSHLDTMVLMGLYPLSQIHRIRPVAAADYFLKNRFLKWFSLEVIGIIPLDRKARKCRNELFGGCREALQDNDILILYPEGSRGEAEQMKEFKKGIFHVANLIPETSVTPVAMHGLGKALPKGEALLVPFNCDVIVGNEEEVGDNARDFIERLRKQFDVLLEKCLTR
ncbi:MAG: 1-acyl-sn-glycerol-3-phosphate acyltransferase [Lentisphaeraceae bacterium]|nr:1-acyl-sn-glycerol-3-phosphate acyltransferase [Lentisphaeraceae bacterium]